MMLKNAPIVILDEATAFTDPENENKIQKSIEELTKGKTLLVIAHRLSTITAAGKSRGYSPAPGTLIFFDWNGDGTSDHVGIVEKTEGSTVYTVEGNSSDAVNQRSYDINNGTIMGYGIL